MGTDLMQLLGSARGDRDRPGRRARRRRPSGTARRGAHGRRHPVRRVHPADAGGTGCARPPHAGVDGFLAGAGTVLTPEQAIACAAVGAAFIVSPGLDERHDGSRACSTRGADDPRCRDPYRAAAALGAGIDHVKVFPAGSLGGRPLPGCVVRAVPGGALPAQRRSPSATWPIYLSRPHVFAVSGSWMVPRTRSPQGTSPASPGSRLRPEQRRVRTP